jgi:hypothetical protein
MLKAKKVKSNKELAVFCGEIVEKAEKSVESKGKQKLHKPPKKRVKVAKAAFDAVLSRLIKSKPVKRG